MDVNLTRYAGYFLNYKFITLVKLLSVLKEIIESYLLGLTLTVQLRILEELKVKERALSLLT